MTLIRLTGAQLRELMQAARMVPPDLRDIFLERVVVHRVAYNVAHAITWGRWTDGDVAKTPSIVFAQPLTGPRCVEFEAGAAPWLKGKNFSVRMDGESETLQFAGPEPHTYRAGFSLTQPAERLELLMPENLPRPSEMDKHSVDDRRIGLGLVRLRILPNTCPTRVEELGKN